MPRLRESHLMQLLRSVLTWYPDMHELTDVALASMTWYIQWVQGRVGQGTQDGREAGLTDTFPCSAVNIVDTGYRRAILGVF